MKDLGKTASKLSVIPVHFPSRDTNGTAANDNCQPIKTLEISYPPVQWAGCLHKEAVNWSASSIERSYYEAVMNADVSFRLLLHSLPILAA
ncbi:hypothetical protein CDAR_207621 [Caerostris darwini]|uniref:Uncharacterized protein n=1 Tax=Caerostris darwini TaxID=1538125 RepID=A0AAV4VHZ0_9ARAC|nr:hypothetical protein CDAR_207621 [Caerostris darwini]